MGKEALVGKEALLGKITLLEVLLDFFAGGC